MHIKVLKMQNFKEIRKFACERWSLRWWQKTGFLPETLMSERLSVKFYTVPWLAKDNRMCQKVQTQEKVLSLHMENCESLQLVWNFASVTGLVYTNVIRAWSIQIHIYTSYTHIHIYVCMSILFLTFCSVFHFIS